MSCPYCNKPIGKKKTYLLIDGERVYMHHNCKTEAAKSWVIVKLAYMEIVKEKKEG